MTMRNVVPSPTVEATAMGNLLTQVRASGELASLADMRAVIRKSNDVEDAERRRCWCSSVKFS